MREGCKEICRKHRYSTDIVVDSVFREQHRMKILQSQAIFLKREFSSAGSEHLPYKQRVGGSNPSTPTDYRATATDSNPSLFCASCCVKTSFPHHSHKIRFTPFRCRSNWASVILCERGCRAIICLFSKVALRRLRRSNPSTPTAKQNIASKPLERVAFVVYAGQGKLVFNLSRICNKVGRTLYYFDSNVLLPLGVEGATNGA